MPNKTFLFVNKDADSSSLTRSSQTEQTSINSHVQRGRRHLRTGNPSTRRKGKHKIKEESPQDGGSSATVSSPSASSTSSGSIAIRENKLQAGFSTTIKTEISEEPKNGDDEALEAAEFARIRTAQQTSDDLISLASPAADTDSLGRKENSSTPPTSLASSPHDIMQIASNSIDPFGESSVAIDQKSYSLIEYYKYVYHPAVWNVETKTNAKSQYDFKTSAGDVIRSALQSDVDMYALLACMSSRRQYVDKAEGHNTDEFLGKALASTRRVLAKPSEHGPKSHEEILMVIFHLYAAEGYRDNTDAAKIHMRGAKTIVDCIGGLSKLRDPQMRELLIIGDGLLSAMALQPCELPCEFDPGDYLTATPPELRLTVMYDTSSIAPAFRYPPRDGVVPMTIQHLIEEIAEINWALTHVKNSTPNSTKHALRWIGMRSMAVRHRLLSMDLPDARLDALRGALVLWVVVTTTILGQLKLGFRISPQIRSKLEAADELGLDWDIHHDIKAWMISLAAMSSIPGSESETWLVRKLNDLISTKKVLGQPLLVNSEQALLQQLEVLQRRFFYHEQVHGPLLQKLVKKLILDVKKSHMMSFH